MKQSQWFTSEEFKNEYHYEGPLGAFCDASGTKICLWAPTADSVFLHFYPTGHESNAKETVCMIKGEKGVWRYVSTRNLSGLYYDFDVTVKGKTRRTADPYAKACGVNGNRSMVIDLAQTDPEGWAQDKAPTPTPEQVIWELHVKDFSWDPAGGFAENDRGKYSALCRTGTTLQQKGKFSTGLDYMKGLGVTHVQLMPVYDFGSVNEENWQEEYNWGYDPVNYNVPEGSYASDPYRGEVRIRELKAAIASLHKAGFRVIMDVVYNHTYVTDSYLERTVPGYYYRYKENGAHSNGSGCGNDIATERSMCAKYILDSVLYWAKEYHMDGFRFDLMGLLDRSLLESIQSALDAEFGTGEKLLYGEPWRGGDTTPSKPVVLCDKGNLKSISGRIGAFCDDTRDAVKGSLMNARGRGFVNGGSIPQDKLRSCLAGWAGEYGAYQTPNQTISYLSCHDDWTLWDKLVHTLDPKQKFNGRQSEIMKANRMAAAINFCCQGRLFFLAGEEFGRTKGGIKNSYCSDSEINQLDWYRAWENRDLVDYYRGWIALRMQLPGLRDKTAQAAKRILWMQQKTTDCVVVCLDNADKDSKWSQLLMICNGSDQAQTGTMPAGKWQLLADGESSFRWQEPQIVGKQMTTQATSVTLLGRIS